MVGTVADRVRSPSGLICKSEYVAVFKVDWASLGNICVPKTWLEIKVAKFCNCPWRVISSCLWGALIACCVSWFIVIWVAAIALLGLG